MCLQAECSVSVSSSASLTESTVTLTSSVTEEVELRVSERVEEVEEEEFVEDVHVPYRWRPLAEDLLEDDLAGASFRQPSRRHTSKKKPAIVRKVRKRGDASAGKTRESKS